MKLPESNREFETNIETESHTSAIIASAAMYKILSDQLYSQKEEAIVRELMANAWDSHVEAGTTDIPVEIHIPTSFEEYFETKDCGTGLPKESVFHLYMNYGASNKQHTNTLIGGFGVGSKAPFCYTDQFTIESRYNGTRYMFQAAINSEGKPTCYCISEKPTDERNGMTIRMHIDGSNEYKFVAAAQKFLPEFPTKAKCNKDIHDLPEPIYSVELKDRKIHVDFCNNTSNTVIQGNVPYNIASSISDIISSVTSKEVRNILHTFKLRIFVPIGTFDLAASREYLSLNNQTSKKLGDIVKTACEELAQILKDNIHSKSTLYDRLVAAKTLKMDFDIPANAVQYIQTGSKSNILLPSPVNTLTKDTYLSRGHRSYVSEVLSINAFIQNSISDVYVAKKASQPFHQFFKEVYFVDKPNMHRVIKLSGDIVEIQKIFDTLGIPCKCKPIPVYKSQAKKKGKPNLGSATYACYANDKFCFLAKVTASDIYDRLQTGEKILHMDEFQFSISDAFKNDLFKEKYSMVVFISTTHNKVIERLVKEGMALYTKDLLDEERIQKLRTAHHINSAFWQSKLNSEMYEKIYTAMGLYTDLQKVKDDVEKLAPKDTHYPYIDVLGTYDQKMIDKYDSMIDGFDKKVKTVISKYPSLKPLLVDIKTRRQHYYDENLMDTLTALIREVIKNGSN